MSKSALVVLAPGFEELEAVAVIDILRRAGVRVVVAGTISGSVPSARTVRIVPDAPLDDVLGQAFDLVVLPGGLEGTENLAADARVTDLLRTQLAAGRAVGAICAAPTILDRHGLVNGKKITCHPGCRGAVKAARLEDARVVRDGQILTGLGAGAAVEFALALVEFLSGKEMKEEVNRGVLAACVS